jgi:hypothetical protein
MPSVFTVDGPSCPWVLKKGKSFKGCYQSERAARRAAKKGWRATYSRPPGVTMRGLGSSEKDHARAAKSLLNDAWTDLERMPPTCRGGIVIAARALGYAQKAQSELASIDNRRRRHLLTDLYGSANYAANAAWKTINHFAGICDAPYPRTRDVPMFSRGKMVRELKKRRRR